jgi:aconitase A
MNTANRKPLPGTKLDYFDTRAAVDAIKPGAYDKLPYTSRVLAENLVRRCLKSSNVNAIWIFPGFLPGWFVMTFLGKLLWWIWQV